MKAWWQVVRPGWVPTIAVAVLLPVLVALGFWQLDRAEQKRALQAEYDGRAGDAPVSIDGRLQPAETLQFHRVVAKGQYDQRYQILLDNRVHNGIPGFHVITPLRIAGSDVVVLVNRGWVALGERRDRLPVVPAPSGPQKIAGVAMVPQQGYRLGPPAIRQEEGWNPVWLYLDLAYYREQSSLTVQPVVILLDDDEEPGGLVRQWRRLDSGIAMHQGYAFQWFAMAVALLLIYLVVMLRNNGSGRNTRDPTRGA